MEPRLATTASTASPKFKDVCLVDAFRALGIKVPYKQDGPFWAIQDGAAMLEPFGCLGIDIAKHELMR